MFAGEAWQPELDPWTPEKGGRREWTPQSYPLAATCTSWHVDNSHTNRKSVATEL